METASPAGNQPDQDHFTGKKRKKNAKALFFHAHITTNRLKIQVLFCCHGRRMLGDGGGYHGVFYRPSATGDRTDFSGSKPPDGPLRPDVDTGADDGPGGGPDPGPAGHRQGGAGSGYPAPAR